MVDEPRLLSVSEIKEVTKEAVLETLTLMGLETDDPIELQKDHSFLRELRNTHEAVKRKGLVALVGAVVLGACTFIVFLLREWLNV